MKYYKWFGKILDGMYFKKGPPIIAIPNEEVAGAAADYGWRELSKLELLIEINHKTPILMRGRRNRWKEITL